MAKKTGQAGELTPSNRTKVKAHLSDKTNRLLDTVLQPYCEWGDVRRKLISEIEDIIARELK